VVGLSGGLIGPDGIARDYAGYFDGTPIFLGCSDVDPHIPMRRVVEAGEVLQNMGADVTVRFYPARRSPPSSRCWPRSRAWLGPSFRPFRPSRRARRCRRA
jgi:predicted esterase